MQSVWSSHILSWVFLFANPGIRLAFLCTSVTLMPDSLLLLPTTWSQNHLRIYFFSNRNNICRVKRSESANGDTAKHLPATPAISFQHAVLRCVQCSTSCVSFWGPFIKQTGKHFPLAFLYKAEPVTYLVLPLVFSPRFYLGDHYRQNFSLLFLWLACVFWGFFGLFLATAWHVGS